MASSLKQWHPMEKFKFEEENQKILIFQEDNTEIQDEDYFQSL